MNRISKSIWLVLISVACSSASAGNNEIRSAAHQAYAEDLWQFANRPGLSHTQWEVADQELSLPGPPRSRMCTLFLNSVAQSDPSALHPGSVVVGQHYGGDNLKLMGYSIWFRPSTDYDPSRDGWYFAHYLPDGTVAKTSADSNPFAKRGYVSVVDNGRLWVFPTASQALVDYHESGEPGKRVIQPGAGPGGMTIMAADTEDIQGYLTAKEGFEIRLDDGRAWVFRSDSEELKLYDAGQESAKIVVRPGAGPGGLTVKSIDAETLDSYLLSKPGFYIQVVDGRLWVFREGSKELAEFKDVGEPAKSTTLPGAGPAGMTIRGPDKETIHAYLAACDGFRTVIEDGRIWVFQALSAAWNDYRSKGFPAVHFTRPVAGPGGMTVKGPDRDTVEAYLRSTIGS